MVGRETHGAAPKLLNKFSQNGHHSNSPHSSFLLSACLFTLLLKWSKYTNHDVFLISIQDINADR